MEWRGCRMTLPVGVVAKNSYRIAELASSFHPLHEIEKSVSSANPSTRPTSQTPDDGGMFTLRVNLEEADTISSSPESRVVITDTRYKKLAVDPAGILFPLTKSGVSTPSGATSASVRHTACDPGQLFRHTDDNGDLHGTQVAVKGTDELRLSRRGVRGD